MHRGGRASAKARQREPLRARGGTPAETVEGNARSRGMAVGELTVVGSGRAACREARPRTTADMATKGRGREVGL